VDVVHAFGPLAAATAVAAVKRTKAKLVTAYQAAAAGGWTRSDPQTAGHRVIALSHYAADLIARRHRTPLEKIVVIPPIVDTSWFDPDYVSADRIATVRESWRVRPEAQVVLLPGRLTESQGHVTLVEAARILLNGGMRGVVFVIAGEEGTDNGYGADIDNRIFAHGMTPIFRRVGRSADIAAAYGAADVVALPLEHADVFSSRAVEAQAMGCPVVASSLGALPEAMIADDDTDGRTGWLIPPHDSYALARALAAALSLDRRSRYAMAVRARDFTNATFSPQHVTAATLAVYEELLQESD
jgi:glycosyltransferase involved in cell wall biosynthesis